jgi:His-Xaa-Ser system protein HxsD
MGLTATAPGDSTSVDQADMLVDLTLYSESVVFRACHEFTGKCFVDVSRSGPDVLIVKFLKQESGTDLGRVQREFVNALLDHRVREEVERITEPIRRLIVAQAFGEADFSGKRNSAGDADPTD